ncbi:MAG: polysaccharide deacetylase family protein [Gemmatimonadetes bacterium]|nr:polysaccharide deacetylase family protein [Gemmatimonadota bacterium]
MNTVRGPGVFALRFDVDSVTCLEHGVPALLKLGERHGVRFTFFVNMGRSFSWRHTVARTLRSRRARTTGDDAGGARANKLPAAAKLGRSGVLKTVLMNPRLGWRYRPALDRLFEEGHELGLHGGSNHATWQYALDELGEDGLQRHVRSSFATFRDRYGQPSGFASPGFRYNEAVLDLVDSEGFEYASDMTGERPFRPARPGSKRRYTHFQVPVNVIGEDSVPVIEQGLALGRSDVRIVRDAVERIRERRFALMYGHPYVEGVHWRLLDAIFAELSGDYEVVTVAEYLRRWKESASHG